MEQFIILNGSKSSCVIVIFHIGDAEPQSTVFSTRQFAYVNNRFYRERTMSQMVYTCNKTTSKQLRANSIAILERQQVTRCGHVTRLSSNQYHKQLTVLTLKEAASHIMWSCTKTILKQHRHLLERQIVILCDHVKTILFRQTINHMTDQCN